MNMQEQLTVQENKEKLKSIMMPLLFCAQYGLALRGKRGHGNIMTGENATSGVFRGLLHLLVATGNKQLENQLTVAKKNATYLSPKIQNEILDCLRMEVEETIIREIKMQDIGPKYCVMADEVTDVSNWEQLGNSDL